MVTWNAKTVWTEKKPRDDPRNQNLDEKKNIRAVAKRIFTAREREGGGKKELPKKSLIMGGTEGPLNKEARGNIES